METTFNRENDILKIKVDGRLDAATSEDFVVETEKRIDDSLRSIEIDCSALEYISSAGLRAFMALYDRICDSGGSITLHGVGEQVGDVLRMTGMNEVFTID